MGQRRVRQKRAVFQVTGMTLVLLLCEQGKHCRALSRVTSLMQDLTGPSFCSSDKRLMGLGWKQFKGPGRDPSARRRWCGPEGRHRGGEIPKARGS